LDLSQIECRILSLIFLDPASFADQRTMNQKKSKKIKIAVLVEKTCKEYIPGWYWNKRKSAPPK
jgi:hypothetical protein